MMEKLRAMISMIFSAFCFFMILTIISQPTSASTGTYNIATTSSAGLTKYLKENSTLN